MALAGRLGKASLAASTNTTLYTVPASTYSTVNINVVNIGQVATDIRIAVSTVASPAATDWLEYDFMLNPGEVLERTGIVLTAAELVVLYSSAGNTAVRVYGFEEDV